MSTRRSAKSENASTVTTSKKVNGGAPGPVSTGRRRAQTSATASRSTGGAPRTRKRSVKACRCGDEKKPALPSSPVNTPNETDPLPLVPATWTTSKARSG